MAKNSKEVQQRADAKRAGARARGWACIVYPESAPEGWVELLNEAHIPTLISPLHDQDKTGRGEDKKPHWHVLAMWENPVGESTAKNYFGRIGVTAPPEKIDTIKGYARYLVHLDDHDKVRYNEADVKAIAGASWLSTAMDEGEEINALLDEIEDWIDATGCVSYGSLCRYARAERSEWTRVIRKNTIHLTALLKSLSWEASVRSREAHTAVNDAERTYIPPVNPETGEIIETEEELDEVLDKLWEEHEASPTHQKLCEVMREAAVTLEEGDVNE